MFAQYNKRLTSNHFFMDWRRISYYRELRRQERTFRVMKAAGAVLVLGTAFAWSAYGETKHHEAENAFIRAQAVETVQTPTEEVIAPPAPAYEPTVEVGTVREVTAYTSEVGQTDASPCVSANGMNICHLYAEGTNICATNAFPLGTVLVVDKLGTCVVHDRMNARYRNRVDWYFGYDTPRALEFGVQNLNVKIYGE